MKPRFLFALAVLTLSVSLLVATVAPRVAAQQVGQRWEYATATWLSRETTVSYSIRLPHGETRQRPAGGMTPGPLEMLNQLGQDGWEVVTVDEYKLPEEGPNSSVVVYYFKRPLP
jgi:hypothetical protein